VNRIRFIQTAGSRVWYSKANLDKVAAALDRKGIETRPLWKPMHLQPLFKNAGLPEWNVPALFDSAFVFASGHNLTDDEIREDC